jgi:hypothetical protein
MPAPAPVVPARAAPPCRLALVRHRHATDRAGEYESGSTPRIQGDGLIPAAAATDLGRKTIFGEQMCRGDRAIEIDHRSSRSRCRSCIRSRNVVTGLRGGGSLRASSGGASQPSRTASASRASARRGLRPGCGGTISATTRSRSVIRTVSPPAARRTYSLSLFLRIFRPTERM